MRLFSVLFVCMGNICRSPTGEGVLRAMLERHGWPQIRVDSAGTHKYHPGSPPDSRTRRHAALRGYDLSALRARQVCAADFQEFDLILAMDDDNLQLLRQRCPPSQRHKLRRCTDFCLTLQATQVPDPYYEGAEVFERVLDLVEDACAGLIRHIQSERHA